jgi:hypothetical protein
MTLQLPGTPTLAALAFALWLATLLAAPVLAWFFERDRLGKSRLTKRATWAVNAAFGLFFVAFVSLQATLMALPPEAQVFFPFTFLGRVGEQILWMEATSRIFLVFLPQLALAGLAALSARRR